MITKKKITKGEDRYINRYGSDQGISIMNPEITMSSKKSKKFLKSCFGIDRKTIEIYTVYYDDEILFAKWKNESYVGRESHMISEKDYNKLLLLYKIGKL